MSKTNPSVKKKALDYKQQRAQAELDQATEQQRQAERPRITDEQSYMDLVGQRIEEATRNGAFDNLRGKGKPLNLQRNPHVPEGMEMAYSIMQNNNIAPEWIGDRAAVLRRIADFRLRLETAVHDYQERLHNARDIVQRVAANQSWQQQLPQVEAQLQEINRQIRTVNLKQPMIHLEIFLLRLDEELTRAGWSTAL